MKISARNQFAGKVISIAEGAVNGIVTLDVDGVPVTGTISMEAIRDLGLEVGAEATAIIKATEVMVGSGRMQISARNQFKGTVASVEKGAVNSFITIESEIGQVSATISNAAVKELDITGDRDVVVIVKATSVLMAC